MGADQCLQTIDYHNYPINHYTPEKVVSCDIDDGRCAALAESGNVYFWGKDSFNYSLSPQFTCESMRNIPFSEREIISKPSVIGS